MTIFDLKRDSFETVTLQTNPKRTFVTSSAGSTGGVYVFARRSSIEKELTPSPSFLDMTHNDSDIASELKNVQGIAKSIQNSSGTTRNIYGLLQRYLQSVNAQSTSTRKHDYVDVIRFTPSFTYTSNTLRKLTVKDVLSKYYMPVYPSAHWAFTNYNCLAFYTSSTVPTSSVMMYPVSDDGIVHTGYATGSYIPSGSFSFDFYINPRYKQDARDGVFKAGTIMHLSSTYAVSLISGSNKDANGRSTGFRIQLQLSHSADVTPSAASPGSYPHDLIFRSDDNSLSWNNWHHVVVRWGTSATNEGTGSFNIDGVDRGKFVIPSSSIAPRFPQASPKVLYIGNFYEGADDESKFFAADPALRDGLNELNSATSVETPTPHYFRHPLNADIHDVAIRRYYMNDIDISTSGSKGTSYIDPQWTAFYLPPFFIEDSPYRRFVGDTGGILQTPFFEVDGTTNDPFNVALSFGVGGHYINVENYVRDFASNVFPRLHHMTGVALMNTTEARSANAFLYDQPFVRRRNTFIMPCDDGKFVPQFQLIASESRRTNAVNALGAEDLSLVNIDNIILTSSLLFKNDFDEDTSFADQLIGFTPETPGVAPGTAYSNYATTVQRALSGTFDPGIQDGAPLTIFQRTRDPSSNQVTFFDISNIFYGKRIQPGSVVLTDDALSGSGGALKITLRDDGNGGMYRADCITSASTWNSVGTVFYDEGIIAIKSPHLYFLGSDGYTLEFNGEQNIHTTILEAFAPAHKLNSSSNPNFESHPPSLDANETESTFVYVSGINFHDDNLNVIARAGLAQPVMKRPGDKFRFRVKMDF